MEANINLEPHLAYLLIAVLAPEVLVTVLPRIDKNAKPPQAFLLARRKTGKRNKPPLEQGKMKECPKYVVTTEIVKVSKCEGDRRRKEWEGSSFI